MGIQKIRQWVFALLFVAGSGGMLMSVALPQNAYAACNDRLLTFPAWFNGLTKPNCDIQSPIEAGGLGPFIWKIVLNIIEFMLQLVGYLSVGFIIAGGYRYMTSAGSSEGVQKAKKTIMNAVVGLLISLFSVAIVNVVSGAIG